MWLSRMSEGRVGDRARDVCVCGLVGHLRTLTSSSGCLYLYIDNYFDNTLRTLLAEKITSFVVDQ